MEEKNSRNSESINEDINEAQLDQVKDSSTESKASENNFVLVNNPIEDGKTTEESINAPKEGNNVHQDGIKMDNEKIIENNQEPGGNGEFKSRVEMNRTKSIKQFSSFQIIITVLVVISLGLNMFLLLKQDGNGPVTSGGSVKQLNYDVKSSTSDVIKDVSDSVVGVLVYSSGRPAGSGSGVVYRVNGKDAYIITNAHVVEGADDVQVVFANQESVEAKVLGSDSYSDIAVLKLTADFDLIAIECGDSSLLDKGETVLAIGSPLGIEYAGTVTQGIVSGTDRTVSVDLNEDGQDDWDMNVIQTDAAINPGNSGGALVNMAGELVGITSMKLTDTTVEGMGFALPINDVIKSVEQIIEKGKVTRPLIGISGVSLSGYSSYQLRYYRIDTDLTDGIYVARVSANGAASKAGIQEGDVIVKFDDKKITTYKSFLTELYAKEPGDKVSVVINRNGIEKKVEVTLDEQ